MRGVISSILPESPHLDESLDGILEVDAVFCKVVVAPMVLIVFCSDRPRLFRGGSRTSDSTVLEVGIRSLRKDTLVESGQRGVLYEPSCWSSMLAGIVRFLLPSFLPSL